MMWNPNVESNCYLNTLLEFIEYIPFHSRWYASFSTSRTFHQLFIITVHCYNSWFTNAFWCEEWRFIKNTVNIQEAGVQSIFCTSLVHYPNRSLIYACWPLSFPQVCILKHTVHCQVRPYTSMQFVQANWLINVICTIEKISHRFIICNKGA